MKAAGKALGLPGADGKYAYKPFPENDPKRRQPDISKAKRVLNWEPKVSLEAGLRPTIEYFQAIIPAA